MRQTTAPQAPSAVRIGGHAWIPNERGDILTVRANHGPSAGYHRLPGGYAEPYESNLAAMLRHTRQETGIAPVPLRLLGTDWTPRHPDGDAPDGDAPDGNVLDGSAPDGRVPTSTEQNFVYLCAKVNSLAHIALPPASEAGELELSGYAWLGPDTARSCMSPDELPTFLGLWRAWERGATAVLQEGRPVIGTVGRTVL
ncbi:NUDIX domain-containing protein [Streptomyces sp. NPDC001493]